jgi:Beta-ketoacyl synthase, N-terminal domain
MRRHSVRMLPLLLMVLSSMVMVQSFSLHHTQQSKTTLLRMSTNENNSHAEKPRVVVTGLGVISGCGIGADDFFQACLDGKSSLNKVQRFDVQYYPCQIASEVPDSMFDPADFFINPKNVKSNDRYTHFAVAAARQALQDSNYGDTPETLRNPSRIGVMVGTAFGGMETFEQETLKLHKKPERPKVNCSEFSFHLFLFSYSHLSSSLVRFLHSPFQHFWETLPPGSLGLNAVVKVPTMASPVLVPRGVTPLVKPWV